MSGKSWFRMSVHTCIQVHWECSLFLSLSGLLMIVYGVAAVFEG